MIEQLAKLVPVDPPEQPQTIYATALAVWESQRRPIDRAGGARNRDEARQLAGWLARYGVHVVLYHLTRLPKYAAKLAMRAPVGVFVALAAVLSWVFDREASPRPSRATRGSSSGAPACWCSSSSRYGRRCGRPGGSSDSTWRCEGRGRSRPRRSRWCCSLRS